MSKQTEREAAAYRYIKEKALGGSLGLDDEYSYVTADSITSGEFEEWVEQNGGDND